MTSVSSAAERPGHGLTAEGGSPRARAAAAGRAGAATTASAEQTGLFARSLREYARQHPDQPVSVLRAGCTGRAGELGLEALHASPAGLSVRSIDQDHPAEQAWPAPDEAAWEPPVRGDLRMIPLPPRAFDVVTCAHLLDRIEHAALVLDRLVAALKPGGLLLLRIRDRQCASGFLDRVLPRAARRASWPWLRPGQAGPFAAVYEPLVSAAGVQAYALARGLVIAGRQAVRDRPSWPPWAAVACRLIARLSRGRLTDDHDDLLFVIRRPVSESARVLLDLSDRRRTRPACPRSAYGFSSEPGASWPAQRTRRCAPRHPGGR